MSRRPKPTHLHLIEGTFRKERHAVRAGEPKPATALDLPPSWFGPEHVEVWEYGLRHSPPGLLKGVDAGVYTVWVCASVAHRQAASELAALGAKGLVNRTGTRQSALVGIMNRQALVMLRAAAELGFSPVSRTRVTVGLQGSDPDDRFFPRAPRAWTSPTRLRSRWRGASRTREILTGRFL